MRVFFVRHGETVDNVAGLYAGSRDSALTNHGVQQARRLGEWLAANKPAVTHVFASPLQRAFKTADAVAAAQRQDRLAVVSVSELVEKDLGSYEGKPFSAILRDSHRSGVSALSRAPGFVDVESRDSLAARSDAFLDAHLLPLLLQANAEHVIAVVSHGILLSNLWRRLLLRLPPKSVTIAPELVTSRGQVTLEHLGGWSNTGFLELSLQPIEEQPAAEPYAVRVDPVDGSASESKQPGTTSVGASSLTRGTGGQDGVVSPLTKSAVKRLDGCRTTILAIDGKPHLAGLKRARGGIGRAPHDDRQKTMDSFFKRAKKDA